ncbi:MAG: hypothetical protein WA855_14395, partial [Candidatus Acidiferrales bacterium]
MGNGEIARPSRSWARDDYLAGRCRSARTQVCYVAGDFHTYLILEEEGEEFGRGVFWTSLN